MAKVQGKGSIQALEKPERTCKRWRLRVSTGYDHIKKRYSQSTKIVHGTKTKAQQELRKFIEEVESGLKLKRAKETFTQYSESWMEERRASGELSEGTLHKDQESIDRVLPYIGNMEMRDFDADNLSRMFTAVRRGGGKRVKEYSGTTMNAVYRTLNLIFEDARRAKVIPENPLRDVKAPKKDTKEKPALSSSDARRLSSLLLTGDPQPNTIGYLLALTCGLRREECCAMRWCDFDAKAVCIRVEHAYPEHGTELMEPKSQASKRIVPLASETYNRLLEWKSLQARQLRAKGIQQTLETPIVATMDGGFMHPQNFARSWKRYAKPHGFEGYTLHQLRHTFATRLVASGVDMKTAATLMGHSSVAMLEKVYAHFVPENASRAMTMVGNDLFGQGEAPIIPFSEIAKTA